MLYLETLGGLSVARTDLPIPDGRPRRRLLAMLALIAGHDPTGITRGQLLSYLWPKSDARRARNSLKQALSSLRQTLGIQVVQQSAGGVFRLDRTLIEVDLWRFEAALARGDEAAAAGAYHGPFLDGFSFAGLEELNRWTKDERERLAHQQADALRILAREADNPASCVPISSLTPTRASDRASTPLRRPERRSAMVAWAVPLPRGWSIPAVPRAVWMAVAVFWAVAFLMNAWHPLGIGSVHGMEPVEPKRVAVAPFSIAGGRESAELGRGLEELLEARLDEIDGVRTKGGGSATSRPGNAQLYVRGQLMVAGDSLRARATLYDRANAHTAVGRAEAAVAGTALFELADALTAQLFAERDRPRRLSVEADLR